MAKSIHRANYVKDDQPTVSVDGAGVTQYPVTCGERVTDAERVTAYEVLVTCATCRKRGPKRAAAVGSATAREGAEIADALAIDLDRQSVYVSLVQRAPAIRKSLKATAEVAAAAGNGGAEATDDAGESTDPDALHLSKDLFNPKDLTAIGGAQNATYLWLYRYAFRTRVRPGFHRLPLGLVPAFVKAHRENEDRTAELVEELIAALDDIKARSRQRLGPLYREADYPTPGELRGAWHSTYTMVAIGPADQLSVISDEMLKSERVKIHEQAREELASIKNALRLEFHGLMEKGAEILAPGADGRAKAFQARSLEKMGEFFSLFDHRNLGRDDDLKAMVAQAAKVLEGVDVAKLKGDAETREKTREVFASIRDALGDMVTLKPARGVKLTA